jgi:fumarate reductase subunit D
MALHVAIAVFMLGWFGLFTWLLAMSGSLKGAIAVPVILIIFGGVMTVGGFVYEANKSEEALRRLLGAA